jgi:hypothetical protein
MFLFKDKNAQKNPILPLILFFFYSNDFFFFSIFINTQKDQIKNQILGKKKGIPF